MGIYEIATRVPFHFTAYNFVAFLYSLMVGRCVLHDLLRATSCLMAVGVASIHLRHGEKMVMSVFLELTSYTGRHKRLVVYPLDFLLHFVPVIVLGVPHKPESVLMGFMTIFSWYMLVRKRLCILYSKEMTTACYDNIMIGVLSIATLFLTAVLALNNNMVTRSLAGSAVDGFFNRDPVVCANNASTCASHFLLGAP